MKVANRLIARFFRLLPWAPLTAACFVLAVLVFTPTSVSAQLQNQAFQTVGTNSGLSTDSVTVIVARVIRTFLGILGILTVILIMYGGYLFFTSQGEPTKIAKAGKIIKNALIGLIIIFSSYALASFILSRLLKAATGNSVTSTSATNYTEPLSGALGSGIVQNHYPSRNALDIPRNTNIMVTFKEAINPSSIILGYKDNPDSTELNTKSVLIYPSLDGSTKALVSTQVVVRFTEDFKTFVFDPLPLLGNAQSDTNYTIKLTSQVVTSDGEAAFNGYSGEGYLQDAEGYAWTFEVSTEVDLTPPHVVSVTPKAQSTIDRNIVTQIAFSEPMDPVAASGTYDPSQKDVPLFTHIAVLADQKSVSGEFRVSNDYDTVEFIPNQACGKDPCGNTIYCLPALAHMQVQAHAAQVGSDAPQAVIVGATYNGLVDAAGNSLDGTGEGKATGSPSDDYIWSFQTSSGVDDEVPEISLLSPTLREGNVGLDTPVRIDFSMPMQSTSLSTNSLYLVPNLTQSLWYAVSDQLVQDSQTKTSHTVVTINHASFWKSDDKTLYYYYPVITNVVKGNNQFCFYPAHGPSLSSIQDCATSSAPYCCDGIASSQACKTLSGSTLP